MSSCWLCLGHILRAFIQILLIHPTHGTWYWQMGKEPGVLASISTPRINLLPYYLVNVEKYCRYTYPTARVEVCFWLWAVYHDTGVMECHYGSSELAIGFRTREANKSETGCNMSKLRRRMGKAGNQRKYPCRAESTNNVPRPGCRGSWRGSKRQDPVPPTVSKSATYWVITTWRSI